MAMSKSMKGALLCAVLLLSVMTISVVGGGHEDGKGMHYPEGGNHYVHGGSVFQTFHRPANPYTRGCSAVSRCRGGGRKLL
ncbi:hypothetical protein K1719_027194 [Acacia pycnantha]|nr:hypothetical protein K1719_047318 [Acacia pycnantha]KAI9093180.1 hypothetical protein K1719_027194 [Acacia pycnantha]